MKAWFTYTIVVFNDQFRSIYGRRYALNNSSRSPRWLRKGLSYASVY